MFKFKKSIALLLSATMLTSIAPAAFAQNVTAYENNLQVLKDSSDERIVTVDDVTAIYNKSTNMVTIIDSNQTYSFSLDPISEPSLLSNRVVKKESVALHAYEYVKTDSGDYYWGVDIPSYSINPNNWCGWISVWDDGSKAGNYGSEFADYIDAAQDDEHLLTVYGGASLVALTVGLITKNPVWSESAFKAACAAVGIVVSAGILDAASSYYNNLDNARENYFAIKRLIG